MSRVEQLTEDVLRLIVRSKPLGYSYAYVAVRNRMLVYLESHQLQHSDFLVAFVDVAVFETTAESMIRDEMGAHLTSAIAQGLIS
jgi:hypothetical protein